MDFEQRDAPEQPDPWWRRPVILVIGIFLIFLIVSLSFSNTFQGIIQSKRVKGNALYFPNATIVFENNTLDALQSEFISNQKREIKACLFGEQNGSDYIISVVEFPEVLRANVVHVVSVPCPIDTLIDLHSHPINECLASEQDISVYSKAKESNARLRMMVMCSSTRFALI